MKVIACAEVSYDAYIEELARIQSNYKFKQSAEILLSDKNYADIYDEAIASYLRSQVENGDYDYSFITEEDHGILYTLLATSINSNSKLDHYAVSQRIVENARKYAGKIIEKDINEKLEQFESETSGARRESQYWEHQTYLTQSAM